MSLKCNRIYQGDCLKLLQKIDAGSIDLAFADPPFNIGYDYDVYQDQRSPDDYLQWSRAWLAEVFRVAKSDGTFWLAIGDEYAAELKIASQQIGFHCRSWVIWYYTFGVNCRRGFSRSHTHLFHFVKDPRAFAFHADNPAVRVPSARQLVYADLRANPRGRLPDNTWILRPQDLPDGFGEDGDTWYYSRVAGTFKEREGFHGCQMPEQLLGRIIRLCSQPNDIVLDPFAGSGTTLAVAKKLGRRYLGLELSSEYVQRIEERLQKTRVGAELDGPAEPLKSAPQTERGKHRGVTSQPGRRRRTTPSGQAEQESMVTGVVQAYRDTHGGLSSDYLLADPDTNAAFIAACQKAGLPGSPLHWNRTLLRLRKQGRLPRLSRRQARVAFSELDPYIFASEMAVRLLTVNYDRTLDEILCDPLLASEFDALAAELAPGFTPRRYRWAAITLRKRAKHSRLQAARNREWASKPLPVACPWDQLDRYREPRSAILVLYDEGQQPLFVGETLNLDRRLEQLSAIDTERLSPASFRVFDAAATELTGGKAALVQRLRPCLNVEWYLSARPRRRRRLSI